MAILNRSEMQDCETGLQYTTGRLNTLATWTGEDKDFIHMGEGNTGENNHRDVTITVFNWVQDTRVMH